MLSDVRGGSYEEKLRDAGLTTLAERRKREDAIEVFKTLNGINRMRPSLDRTQDQPDQPRKSARRA